MYHTHTITKGVGRRKESAKFTVLIHHSLNVLLLLFYNSLTITFSFFYNNFFFFWKQDLRSWFFAGTCCKNKLQNEKLADSVREILKVIISFIAWYTCMTKVHHFQFLPFPLHTQITDTFFYIWIHSLITKISIVWDFYPGDDNFCVIDGDATQFNVQCTGQLSVKSVQIYHSWVRGR